MLGAALVALPRRLVADVMLFCGWRVTHILGLQEASTHRLAEPVRVGPEGLSYGSGDPQGGSACC